nr:MAG TPA: helix-turn-helix domain protein [Caudoviricetes sp.]
MASMTQTNWAKALGVTKQTVSKWEQGETEPRLTKLALIAKLSGMPAEQLLHGE